jgi:hypothetical protein
MAKRKRHSKRGVHRTDTRLGQHGLKWITAVHEAGHALGARLAGSEITEATVVPTANYSGQVHTMTFGWEQGITECLLGHAAELEFGYQGDYGHGGDYDQAQKLLKDLIKYERSETLGIPHFEWDVRPRYAYRDGKYVNLLQEWRNKMRVKKSEWKPRFDSYRRRARRLAKKHRAYIEKVALLLVEKSTLSTCVAWVCVCLLRMSDQAESRASQSPRCTPLQMLRTSSVVSSPTAR